MFVCTEWLSVVAGKSVESHHIVQGRSCTAMEANILDHGLSQQSVFVDISRHSKWSRTV